MGAHRNFSLGAKVTPPFPFSPFSFLSFPSPLHVVLPSLPSGHLNPAFGEGCIANYSENQLVLPSLPCPFLSPFSPPFPHPPFPFLFSFLSIFPLSFLQIWARGSGGLVSKQRKLNYLKLCAALWRIKIFIYIQSTNRQWFSQVTGNSAFINV